jgi:hypothetical protein
MIITLFFVGAADVSTGLIIGFNPNMEEELGLKNPRSCIPPDLLFLTYALANWSPLVSNPNSSVVPPAALRYQ